MNGRFHTVIFDLDGTLYEDVRVYDRYAEELSKALLDGERRQYRAEWEQAKRGESVARVGMGYDLARDLLFRHKEGRVVAYVDWDGRERPPQAPVREAPSEDVEPPIEEPAFGTERFNIGDWWRLPDVLAAHFGVSREARAQAFADVREYMATDAFHLELEPGMRELLAALRAEGLRLVALSNSPRASVADVLQELSIKECFDAVVTDARKPAGMQDYVAAEPRPAGLLSVGDNYVNDIEPVLEAGGAALYIDRHRTGLGEDRERCRRVDWIPEAIGVLRARLVRLA